MKTLYLFRSNLRILEDYHSYTNLKDFKNNCWDFYLLLPLWLLENDYFDKVYIIRLQPKRKHKDIIFNINGKEYIQKFVNDFEECFKLEKPEISFFRGGFKEYDQVLMKNKKFFGKTLYLGASKRMFPSHDNLYDKILLESELELNINNPKSISFYKIANPRIFKPLNKKKIYDICFPNNFTQINYKGQKFFFETLAACSYLKKLKIVHIGNKSEVGKKICKRYGITNIEFKGKVTRKELNDILNISKVGLVTSNLTDGCPRISTEILSSGTPLLLRKKTRLLNYYKKEGVINFNDKKMIKQIKIAVDGYKEFEDLILKRLGEDLSFDLICKKNIEQW